MFTAIQRLSFKLANSFPVHAQRMACLLQGKPVLIPEMDSSGLVSGQRIHCQPDLPAHPLPVQSPDNILFHILTGRDRLPRMELLDKIADLFNVEVADLYFDRSKQGELMALTFADVDLEAGTININKTYHKIDGRQS